MLPQRTRIEAAVQLALEGVTVVTSSTRAARRLQAQCALREHPAAWKTPDILPLDAWIERIWAECLLAGVIERPLLRPAQARALWRRIVSTSAHGGTLLNVHGAAHSAIDAWKIVHEYQIPLAHNLYTTTEETRAFFDWSRSFITHCRRETWIDPIAALQEITSLAGNLPSKPAKLAVFGFDSFTPAQQKLWGALQRAEIPLTLLTPELHAAQGFARSVGLEDSESELLAAAGWARECLETGRGARVGIIVAALESLRATAERIFEEFLHPERLVLPATGAERSFDISLGAPLGEYPIVHHAILLIRFAISGLSPAELSCLMRSPYLGRSSPELCRRAQLDVTLRTAVRSNTNPVSLGALIEEQGASVPALCSQVRAMACEMKRIPGSLTRSEWSYYARRILNAAGWPGDGEGGRKRDSVEFQAADAWEGLLKEFAALDVVEGPASPATLLREVEQFARERMFAPENQFAPVQIVGTLEAAGDSFDALWICGLSDEAWPPGLNANPCIPLVVQRKAGVPAASSAASLAQASLITSRLLQSAEECFLSWPRRDEDRELRPSPVLAEIPATASAALQTIPERWAAFDCAPRLEPIVDEMAPPISGSEITVHGTSLLKRQSNCPFQSFAGNRLLAEDIERVSMGLDPKRRGRLVESALQRLWEQLRTSGQLVQPQVPEVDIDREIEKAVDAAMAGEYPVPQERWEQRYRAIERDRLLLLAREWLKAEEGREPFDVVGHQLKVDIELGGLRIHGRIDRLDRTHRGDYAVIDYKTGYGPYSITQWIVPRPSEPQLPIYAVTQLEQGREIAGVAYAHVRSGQCCFKADARAKEVFAVSRMPDPTGFRDRIEQWKPELARLAEEFLSGHSEVDPKSPPQFGSSPCRNCSFGDFCRIAEMELPEPRMEMDDEEP